MTLMTVLIKGDQAIQVSEELLKNQPYLAAALEANGIEIVGGDSQENHVDVDKNTTELSAVMPHGIFEGYPPSDLKLVPKKYPHSPLRYPGGKSRAIKSILPLIPENETVLCSPFLGGGSIELACIARGMTVYGSDIFFPLMDFWDVLLKNPHDLVNAVKKYSPLPKSEFTSLKKGYLKIKNKLERAAVYFVLNRSSRSGLTFSGGMSLKDTRFTESSMEHLKTFKVNNFYVECADFRESIKKHEDCFLYLDPPYLNGQKLYGFNGDTQKNFDHKALADILHSRDRWVLSYNDCPAIRELYADYPMRSMEWPYGMNKDKKSNEILVLSRDHVKKNGSAVIPAKDDLIIHSASKSKVLSDHLVDYQGGRQ